MSDKRIPVEDRAGLGPRALHQIEALVESHLGLDDVVRWGRSLEPRVRIAGVVVQDEYTHDVVLRAAEGLVLVYDTT